MFIARDSRASHLQCVSLCSTRTGLWELGGCIQEVTGTSKDPGLWGVWEGLSY